jgi:hypothetical protein
VTDRDASEKDLDDAAPQEEQFNIIREDCYISKAIYSLILECELMGTERVATE